MERNVTKLSRLEKDVIMENLKQYINERNSGDLKKRRKFFLHIHSLSANPEGINTGYHITCQVLILYQLIT
jgi:hypothetical protein